MHDSTLIVNAAAFAAAKHRDQRRKSGDIPYVNHPLSVARALAEEAGVTDAVTLAAAILHDTLEDTETTTDELMRDFGAEVANVVAEVTDDKSLPKAERKRRQVAHAAHLSPRARLVKLADKLDNLRDLLMRPPPSWNVERIRGYFCWAATVVEEVGNVEAHLWQAVQGVLAHEIEVGGQRLPAVPSDPGERKAALESYYAQMERARD